MKKNRSRRGHILHTVRRKRVRKAKKSFNKQNEKALHNRVQNFPKCSRTTSVCVFYQKKPK